MIAGLRGTIVRFGAARVYLDTGAGSASGKSSSGGVIYEVQIPLSVQARLQAAGVGASTELFIYHHITESDQRLFGFLDLQEREFFIALQNIKGLGTALALSILSHLDPAALLDLCSRKDAKGLSKIPRIGKTTAETLIFEINRRREKWEKALQLAAAPDGAQVVSDLDEQQDLAVQALLQLGYKESEARKAIAKIAEKQDTTGWGAAEWIAAALRVL